MFTTCTNPANQQRIHWRIKETMDLSHVLLVVRFRARSSLSLILTSAGPEMCRVVVGPTYCNKGNTPFVRNVKETKWATLPRHSTVIPIAKKCPKNQILSENISKASIYSSKVIEAHFCTKNSYFSISSNKYIFGHFTQSHYREVAWYIFGIEWSYFFFFFSCKV